MRTTIIIASLLLAMSCSRDDGGSSKPVKVALSAIEPGDTVWVCSGRSSKRYHATDTCRGLSGCKGDILWETRDDAEEEGRTHCHKCIAEE